MFYIQGKICVRREPSDTYELLVRYVKHGSFLGLLSTYYYVLFNLKFCDPQVVALFPLF